MATLKRQRYFLRFIDVVLFGRYCLSGHPPEAETIAQQLQEAGVIRTECQLLSGPGSFMRWEAEMPQDPPFTSIPHDRRPDVAYSYLHIFHRHSWCTRRQIQHCISRHKQNIFFHLGPFSQSFLSKKCENNKDTADAYSKT